MPFCFRFGYRRENSKNDVDDEFKTFKLEFMRNKDDPFNVSSNRYKKWEQWFYRKIPEKSSRLRTESPLNEDSNLRGFRLLVTIAVIQMIAGYLLISGPKFDSKDKTR